VSISTPLVESPESALAVPGMARTGFPARPSGSEYQQFDHRAVLLIVEYKYQLRATRRTVIGWPFLRPH
jgi:hypothetical protein